MIIDGHAHLGGEYKDLAAILATLDRARADKVVLCPADQQRHDSLKIPDFAGKMPTKELNFVVNRLLRLVTGKVTLEKNLEKGNEEVFNISSLSKGRILQFFWADPAKKTVVDELEEKYELWRFKGIKLHQAVQSFKLNSLHFQNVAEFAVRKKIPIFIHLYSKKEVVKFISVSERYKTNFILGHLIGLEILLKLKNKLGNNVFFDISCPPLVSKDRVKLAIKEFGSERIIMGSDIPYGENNIMRVIEEIRSLNLGERETELILGNNLKNILFI
jgi:uncharacterized protein